MVDDFAHFVKEHDRDLQRVQREWTELYGFAKCSVSDCAQMKRHYERRWTNGSTAVIEEDALYSFYESMYDRVHQYIFHLYDIGMRVDMSSLNLSGGDQRNGTQSYRVSVDAVIAAERNVIKLRRKTLNLRTDGCHSVHSKYAIQASNLKNQITLIDAAFDNLTAKSNGNSKYLERMIKHFENNAYDSDSIEMDIEDFADSNLYHLIEQESVFKDLSLFVRSVNLRRAAFSTGFRFKYKKRGRKLSFDVQSNIDDCKCVSDIQWESEERHVMFVKAKHQSLKEEILESGFIGQAMWHNVVLIKAQKYIETEIGRKITWEFGDGLYTFVRLTLRPRLQHFIAIILYCDFSALCTAFSATSRRDNVFESVESVISRHSNFALFGELLGEMVRKFGITGEDGNGAQMMEKGTFFCGINRTLNIGSYALCLNGPCSTSVVRTVALNFATESGVILEITNKCQGEEQKFFDCSWISQYAEEAERLWMNGDGFNCPLKIVSIITTGNNLNYENAITSLYIFDKMLSGYPSDWDSTVELDEWKFISDLICWSLKSGINENVDLDPFLKREWLLFLDKKEKIMLNLWRVDAQHSFLTKLLQLDTVTTKDDIVRPEWLSLFPSLHTLDIRTTTEYFDRYEISLYAFQRSLHSTSPAITVLIDHNGDAIRLELLNALSVVFDAGGWNVHPESMGNWLHRQCKDETVLVPAVKDDGKASIIAFQINPSILLDYILAQDVLLLFTM